MKLRKSAILALALMLTLFSCIEQEPTILNNDVNFKQIDYQAIGQEHNRYMNEAFKISIETGQIGKPVQQQLNFNISKEKQGELYDYVHSMSRSEKIKLIVGRLSSSSAKETFYGLREILYSAKDYSELVGKMNLMKETVDNYDGLDYAVLMNYIEMSKASAYLWFPKELGGSGNGTAYMKIYNSKAAAQRTDEELEGGDSNDEEESDERTTIEDDVLGGALGMVGWALTGGAALGPFGALGGFVAGTVYGAVTGSLFG